MATRLGVVLPISSQASRCQPVDSSDGCNQQYSQQCNDTRKSISCTLRERQSSGSPRVTHREERRRPRAAAISSYSRRCACSFCSFSSCNGERRSRKAKKVNEDTQGQSTISPLGNRAAHKDDGLGISFVMLELDGLSGRLCRARRCSARCCSCIPPFTRVRLERSENHSPFHPSFGSP